jgi:hypothetical protein
MTQPKFAPILPNVEVRDLYKLPPPPPWRPHRPADFRPAPDATWRPGRGSAGPDQGYGLLLAERFAERIRTVEGEHPDDVLHGASVIALRRAAMFGRAPVAADLELALRLFGYLGTPTEEMIEARRAVFGGVAHDYWRERQLADLVPEATLHMTPDALAERLESDPGSFPELAGTAEFDGLST